MQKANSYDEFLEFTKSNTLVKYNPPVSLNRQNGKPNAKRIGVSKSVLDSKQTKLKETEERLQVIFPPKIISNGMKEFTFTVSF